MWRQDRGEFAVMTLTTLVIVATALLEGVLIGLAAGIVLAAVRMSQTVIRQHTEDDTAKVVMAGNATFLRLPQVIEALESAAEAGRPRIRLDLTGVTHLDHACRSQVEEFTAQQRGKGLRVELLMPGPAKPAPTGTDTAPAADDPARSDPLPAAGRPRPPPRPPCPPLSPPPAPRPSGSTWTPHRCRRTSHRDTRRSTPRGTRRATRAATARDTTPGMPRGTRTSTPPGSREGRGDGGCVARARVARGRVSRAHGTPSVP